MMIRLTALRRTLSALTLGATIVASAATASADPVEHVEFDAPLLIQATRPVVEHVVFEAPLRITGATPDAEHIVFEAPMQVTIPRHQTRMDTLAISNQCGCPDHS